MNRTRSKGHAMPPPATAPFAVAAFGLVLALAAMTFGAGATPAAAPPCVSLGTPAPTGSPEAAACQPTGPGTPVAGGGLTITLGARQTEAGPVDLVVKVRDEGGRPVDDADVSIVTTHLEMDHGSEPDRAAGAGGGRYVAEEVAMGMGGRWQAEVVVERPGQPPVSVRFVVDLAGPQ
jgi:hypothetical protein